MRQMAQMAKEKLNSMEKSNQQTKTTTRIRQSRGESTKFRPKTNKSSYQIALGQITVENFWSMNKKKETEGKKPEKQKKNKKHVQHNKQNIN